MAVETLKKVAVQFRLENGRDTEGNMQYVNQTLQYVGKDSYDGDKVIAIASALGPCLSKVLAGAQSVKTSTITPN